MKEKELVDLIEEQSKLINFNSSLLVDLGIFYNENIGNDEREVIVGNLFFDKVAYLLEREIILNYSYLFSNSDNDFYRLPKTTCSIIQKYKKLTWIEPVALDVITDYAQKIDVIIDSDKIKKIRDKAIAHRESKWKTKIPAFDYKSLQDLNALCGEINDKVFRNLSNKVPLSSWDNYTLMSMDNIVKNLAEHNKLREKYYGGEDYGRQ